MCCCKAQLRNRPVQKHLFEIDDAVSFECSFAARYVARNLANRSKYEDLGKF